MRVISEYTLMLKDTELIDFSLETEDGTENGLSKKLERVHINKIYDNSEMILPIPLFCELSDDSLMSWLMNRRVPPTRHNADKLLVSIGASESLARFVAATLMLSLNDAYWTRPHGAAMRWQDVSLFSAPFDERISYTAFTGELKKIYASGRVVSPEFTTNGTLKKFWRRCDDGIIELVKGDALFGGDMSRSQAVNEYFAAELAEAMGIAHVMYDLDAIKKADGTDDIVCVAPLFTSENVGFVPADEFCAEQGVDMSAGLGSPVTQRALTEAFDDDTYADMMIFDAIIGNRDRHLGNFGYLRDNDTGEYIKPAPLFDNGMSLLYGAAGNSQSNVASYSRTARGKYLRGLDDYARLFLRVRHISMLQKLLRFSFTNHPTYKVSDEMIAAMTQFVRNRVKRLMEAVTIS